MAANTAKKAEKTETKKAEEQAEFEPEFAGPSDQPKKRGGSKKTEAKSNDAKVENQEQEEMVLGFEGLSATKTDNLQVQPRARKIPVPKVIYREARKALRPDDEGNDKNQISSGVHQWDPNRRVSYNPVMPNLARLQKFGNPFPADPNDETVETTDTWRQYVPFVHAVYKVLSDCDRPVNMAEIMELAAKETKAGFDKGKPLPRTWKVLSDTLRDLRNAGIVGTQREDDKVTRKSTFWGIVGDPTKLEYSDAS